MNISRKLALNLYEQVLRYKDQKDATPNHFTMPHCQRLTIALCSKREVKFDLNHKTKVPKCPYVYPSQNCRWSQKFLMQKSFSVRLNAHLQLSLPGVFYEISGDLSKPRGLPLLYEEIVVEEGCFYSSKHLVFRILSFCLKKQKLFFEKPYRTFVSQKIFIHIPLFFSPRADFHSNLVV